MNHVDWAQSAVDDLDAIRRYLADISPQLADDLIARIILSTDVLLDFPAAGSAIGYRRWRRWHVRRTPYLLIYEPVAAGLRIVRVRHQRE
ncbi:type II toxin-antitoxin system RelE/ParE family toxin, partial [Acinetobacter baumannii]